MAEQVARRRPFSAAGRRGNLSELDGGSVDVLVVGGGITGAGVADEATRRGYSVALVEAKDFASGTSSRSSKLVHGGFRYLAQGQVGLVREALAERARLARDHPDLVRRIPFLMPIPPGWRQAALLKAGLITYDLLSLGGGFPRHHRLGLDEARRHAPALRRSDIRGAWMFWDAQTDDSRLTLRVVQAAAARGALVANYAALAEARHGQGQWTSAVWDSVEGRRVEVRSRWLVNATGVWADAVEGLTGHPPGAHLRPSKGVHLSLSLDLLPISSALIFPVGDGRVLFAIPWHGHVIVGTTDADFNGDINAPACSDDEALELLGAVNRFFGLSLGMDAVMSRWAGVRPLVSGSGRGSTKDLSRRPYIECDSRGLVTVTGGKLTTFRRMASDALDRAGLAPRADRGDGDTGTARGADAQPPATNDGGNSEPLPGDAGYTASDVIRACDEEMALGIDDVLSRRLRLSFVDVAAARQAAPMVADLLEARGCGSRVDLLGRFHDVLRSEFGG